MKYRKLAGEEVSVLGFGCMRFPLTDKNDAASIDREKASQMIRLALDSGVNYFDTAYVYHSEASEGFLGEALGERRKDVFIATKLPTWMVRSADDFDKFLDEQLRRLGTGYIDFYLLHALDRGRVEKTVKPFGLIEKLDKAKAEGKIKHIGFSFHDDIEAFKEIIGMNPNWEFCQIQFNYINTCYQAGLEGLEYAHKKGLDVIIMEPLLGGRLADPAPQVKALLSPEKTPAEWAFDYLWNREEVSITLSGMSFIENVRDNIAYASKAEVGMLSAAELDMLEKAKGEFEKTARVPCTKCAYCMPCPFGLDIPGTFDIYNKSATRGVAAAREMYAALPVKADQCRKCRKCESVCPQNIKISQLMEKISGDLG